MKGETGNKRKEAFSKALKGGEISGEVFYKSSGNRLSLPLRRCRPNTTKRQKTIDITRQTVNGISDRNII